MARNNRHPRINNHRNSVKLLQRPEDGLEAFMDASVDAFLLFDENLDLVSINPAGERMFVVSKEMVVGKNIVNLEPDIKKTGKYIKYLDVVKTGEPFFIEDIFAHPKFGDMQLSIKAFKMRKGLGMIVNDITERKRIEEAVKSSEKYFRALTENALDAVAVVSKEGNVNYESPSFQHMLGYELEGLKGKNSFELVHPDDLSKAADLFTELIQNPSDIVKTEIRCKHRDGSWRTLEVVVRNLLNDPAVSGIVANFSDITEQRRMEEALRESELVATTTIEGMADGVMLVNMDGKVTYVNKAFEKLLGYRMEELAGTSAVALPTYRGSKDKKRAREALKNVIEKGSAEPIDMIALTKSGAEIPINFTASVVKDARGNPKTLVAVIRDVTERRKAEEALKESEQRFRAIFDSAVDGMVLANPGNKKFYTCNRMFSQMLGYSQEEIKNLGVVDIHPSEDLPYVMQQFERQVRGEITLAENIPVKRKDGSIFYADVNSSLITVAGESYIMGTFRDITERRQMEEALREGEKRLRDIAENSREWIWEVDTEGKYTYSSRIVESLLGYKPEEILEKHFYDLFHPDDRESLKQGAFEAFARKEPFHEFVNSNVSKDGKTIWLSTSGIPLFDDGGNLVGYRGSDIDITERKQAEERIKRSWEIQTVLNDLLRISLTDISLEKQLQLFLERIVTVSSFALESRGAIFLAEERTDVLVLKAQHRLSESLLSVCARVPFGRCLCGMAALSGKVQYADIVDERHDNQYEGMTPHGHYCVPIMSGNKVLGVINLYVSEGHTRDETEEGFLKAVSDVIAGIIERKQAEESLRKSEAQLRTIFGEAAIGIMLLDMNAKPLEVNHALLKMIGYSMEEFRSISYPDYVHPDDLANDFEFFGEMVAGKRNDYRVEKRFIRKDGGLVWTNQTLSLIRDAEGNPQYLVILVEDISERRRAEEDVRRLSDAVRMSTDSIVVTDMRGKILDGNEASVRMYGTDNRADLIGMKAFDIIAPEDRETAFEKMKEAIEKGYVSGLEYHILTRDGRTMLVEASTSVMRGSKGEPVGFVGVSRDITERKRMEEALQASEARYRLLAENVEDVILTNDTNLRTTYVSPSVTQLTGYSVEEAVAHMLEEAMSPASVEIIMKAFSEGMAAEEKGQKDLPKSRVLELELNRKDGSRVPVEMKVTALRDPEGKLTGMISVTRDITERKKTEEALKVSEERYRLLVENANEFIVVAQDGVIKFFNSKVVGLLGYSRQELAFKPFIEFIHPEDRQMVAERYLARLRGEELPDVYSFRVVSKTGEVRWVEINAVVINWEGRPATLNFLTDITERRESEEALKKSEEKLRLMFESINDGIVVTDLNGVIIDANEGAAKIGGFSSREAVLGRSAFELITPRYHEEAAVNLQKTLGKRSFTNMEYTLIRADGSEYPGELSAALLEDASGNPVGFVGVVRDITERKSAEEEKRKLEEQLQLAGHLASVGELAAGVAHELNNPLAAILGFAQLLTAKEDLDEATKKDLGIIYRESQRATKITQNLLSFARRHEPEKQPVLLNEVIEKTLELGAHRLKVNNIEVVVDFASDLPKTMVDFFQMQQVFVNIINNAEQAMMEAHGRGRLVVKTLRVGDMIRVSFADNGPGIPEENMKRVFDPFFTTKEVGKGTGLGLSICYGLVEAHGGRIYAMSKPGQGATFVVEIPIVAEGQ